MNMPECGAEKMVFLAEDNQALLELMTLALRQNGYSVMTSRDGASAVQDIQHFRPDAIVLDVNMPALNGFEILRTLWRSSSTSSIPVLMVSTRDGLDDIRTACALGAHDYLPKPFSVQDFVDRVSRMMRPKMPAAMPMRPDYFVHIS